jgi:hypothetical protein
MLEGFYTDLVAVKGWPRLAKGLVPPRWRHGGLARMAARVPYGLPPAKVIHWPGFAMEYFWRQRRAKSPAELTATHVWAGREFCRLIVRHGLGQATAVYTFNSQGLELLRHARERGLRRVMEQTIAPADVEDELLAEEHNAFPGWEAVPGADGCRAEFAARERAEWGCSDLIVCGSEFVREGIAKCGGPVDRCAVVPYGVDCAAPSSEREKGTRLRVLTAAGVSLRKGAPYVLEAARALRGAAEFRWCGGIDVLPRAASQLRQYVELRGAVPRPLMAGHYAWADVFLLPSICEGSAIVCYEALAAGLPVITTPNAGSVVRDGVDGFIVPLRNPEAIVEKVELLTGDPDMLRQMSANAAARGREFTLKKFGDRLITALQAAGAHTK